jgi:outer membrane protein assembly factor BamB
MYRWKLWLVVAPVAVFVLGTMMASCGGGGGCFGSYNSLGQFILGLCPTASPSPGYSLQSINICPGPPPATATPTKTSGPTVTPTACQTASSGMVPSSGATVAFNAQGFLAKGKKKSTYADITDAPSTLWTSNNNPPGGPLILQPPTTGNGGVYTGISNGCACINVSSGGVIAQPIPVSVGTDVAGCPACPTVTPTATPTSTPKGSAAALSEAGSAGSSGGTVLWTFDGRAAVTGPIVTGPDGTANFITSDSILHSVDAQGHQIFDRPAGGLAPAIGPDGTIFVQGTTNWIYGLDSRGRPKWKAQVGSGNGPLAADDSAVYANEDDNLIAISEGHTLWNLPLGALTRGVIIPGGVVVASNGGSMTAVTSSGSTLWTFAPSGGFSGELAAANGLVYAGSTSGTVYALDANNGSMLWQVAGGAPVIAGPVVSSTGTVLFGSDALYAIDAGGNTLWSVKSLNPLAHGVAALTNGTVFDATGTEATAAMLDLDGNVEWTARDLGSVVHVSAGPSSIVYTASSDGHVRALR